MNPKRHAKLARDLIDACGGLTEASDNCRVGVSTLSTYQNPNEAATMPADVMACLEAYCGEPIYSREIASIRPWSPTGECPVKEAHDVVIAAANLGPLAMAFQNGEPGAADRFEAALDELKREAAEARATVNKPVLSVVQPRGGK